MANPKRKVEPPGGEKDRPSSKAGEKVREVRRYHAIGRRALGKAVDGRDGRAVPIGELAAEAGVGDHVIRLAKRFASLYGGGDLERLLAHRDARGHALSWSKVQVVIRVAEKPRRLELQRLAVDEGWSIHDLRDRVGTGGSGRGGRRNALPTGDDLVLPQLIRRCTSWLDTYRDLGGVGRITVVLRRLMQVDGSPERLGEVVERASKQLKAMQVAAVELEEEFRKLRPKLRLAARRLAAAGDEPPPGKAGRRPKGGT